VRARPMLRRLITFSALVLVAGEPAAPLVPVLLFWLREPAKTGSRFIDSARLPGATAFRLSGEMTVSGVGLSLPFWITREPVTIISAAVASATAACGAVWANAGPAMAANATDTHNDVLSFMVSSPFMPELLPAT